MSEVNAPDAKAEEENDGTKEEYSQDINIECLLRAACVMKQPLISQRIHQKSSNILHPSLKLICSEASDLKVIRHRIEQLVSCEDGIVDEMRNDISRVNCEGEEQHTSPQTDENDATVSKTNGKEWDDDENKNEILHNCLKHIDARSQTAEVSVCGRLSR